MSPPQSFLLPDLASGPLKVHTTKRHHWLQRELISFLGQFYFLQAKLVTTKIEWMLTGQVKYL